MPHHPDFPTREDEERAPDPARIIDRIINGRLGTVLRIPADRAVA